jgi:hypothetical protein
MHQSYYDIFDGSFSAIDYLIRYNLYYTTDEASSVDWDSNWTSYGEVLTGLDVSEEEMTKEWK